MKRVQEKIKDLVDVRGYETVKNFASDHSATVAAYRFTDATADLMAKWLDETVEIGNRATGAARALAGNRGVGKSHFIAVLAALAAHTDLRALVSDTHVGSSAQRLPRQKHFVVSVERGLGASLADELRLALDRAFGAEALPWGDSPAQMLTIAASRAGHLPLVVAVDSAFDRHARVKRDDGALLGEMAEIAKQNKIFLAIALDDDIAGADGVNAAIARTCTIDFLDQEHLYRVVETFLFQKRPAARSILLELYQGLRETATGFNWSEPRFASLYPIHPVVVDITPAIRLYAPKFSFLSFAAENAQKLINRPAHSLLALDEVFDRIEPELRKAPELSETFETYDELTTNAVAQIPIMQRMQAKLILKGLFLLSLDGRGATAPELGAALLIYDENEPAAAVRKIEETIKLFASQIAASKLRQTVDKHETRFVLGSNANANFENKVQASAALIEPDVIGRILRRAGNARFADWGFGDFGINHHDSTVEIGFEWRGTTRHGRLIWNWETESDRTIINSAANAENFDWQIYLTAPDSQIEIELTNREIPTILWRPAALRSDEAETVRRFAALLTNPILAQEFGETAVAAEQTTAALVERIWSRIYLEDGKLFDSNGELDFSSEAKSARTLTIALAQILTPIFDRQFPAHPKFAAVLNGEAVSAIVGSLFAASNIVHPAAQQFAETFAGPLGLVQKPGAEWVFETDERLLQLPLVKKILEHTALAGNKKIGWLELNDIFKSAPNGLNREAQYLILAALVARRRLEFVTATNDRITHRSLDLQIDWNEIWGVAPTLTQPRQANELAAWANLIADTTEFSTLDDQSQREKATAELAHWLQTWRANRIAERFDELPDEALNVRAWRTAAYVKRSFGAVAEILQTMMSGEISLDEALERAIDAFGNSTAALAENRRLLGELEIFVNTADLRQTVWRYVTRVEAASNPVVEVLRQDLLNHLLSTHNAFDSHSAQTFSQNWNQFQLLYQEFYVERHDRALAAGNALQTLQTIEQSPEWKEFAGLAALPFLPAHFIETSEKLIAELKAVKCTVNAAQMLQTQPFCQCGFRLSQMRNLEQITLELKQTVQNGRQMFRRTLAVLAAPLAEALTEIAGAENIADFANRAQTLREMLIQNQELPILAQLDVRLLAQAAAKMSVPTVRVRSPRNIAAQPLDSLRQRYNNWFDNLPNAPVLVKILEE